ncbi:MAG TPA: MBL fold metallo-hydrolase [Nevskiaceae bacterium]|nr:MBL fold metallo-hydrolase [Nevskiaceae bacterium]
MRFATLGSGSKGNATIVEAGGTRVLIDCGFSLKEAQARSERLAFDLESLDAVLVTHEHSDHVGGVARLAMASGIPVYATRGTAAAAEDLKACEWREITPHGAFTIGSLEVQPFPVPHDAREPCQFVFAHAGVRLGILSDVGRITNHVVQVLSGCDALLLEFNHDAVRLADGPYPPALKRRVGGDWGHLSNTQAAGLLRAMDRSRLRQLVLTHLSEKNNSPALARAAACEALQEDPAWCVCAEQDEGLAWRDL